MPIHIEKAGNTASYKKVLHIHTNESTKSTSRENYHGNGN